MFERLAAQIVIGMARAAALIRLPLRTQIRHAKKN